MSRVRVARKIATFVFENIQSTFYLFQYTIHFKCYRREYTNKRHVCARTNCKQCETTSHTRTHTGAHAHTCTRTHTHAHTPQTSNDNFQSKQSQSKRNLSKSWESNLAIETSVAWQPFHSHFQTSRFRAPLFYHPGIESGACGFLWFLLRFRFCPNRYQTTSVKVQTYTTGS